VVVKHALQRNGVEVCSIDNFTKYKGFIYYETIRPRGEHILSIIKYIKISKFRVAVR
jgi:hypothetical protein